MNKLLVLQSDFGLSDGAVAAMVGVAHIVDPTLNIHHLTHDITPFHLWEASYRLYQTMQFWPQGTTFVSVVDPGVGSARKSVVAETVQGHYLVTPDNGTLTHIKKFVGIKAVREIDESKHRYTGSEESHTFHGRDVYTFSGAKLASGQITFEEVGPQFKTEDTVELEMGQVTKTANSIKGSIDILDIRFGSLWTNIPNKEFLKLGFTYGDYVEVKIMNGATVVYNNRIKFGKSFADVNMNEQIIYINSLLNAAVAINQGNFAKAYSIGTGTQWVVEFSKAT